MHSSILDKLVALRDERKAARTADGTDGGFTLIELLVVVVIIGILIAIAIPLYLNYQKGAKDKATQSDIRAAVSTMNQCYTDNANAYPVISMVYTATTTITCGTGNSETFTLSTGTSLAVVSTATAYTLAASNSGGNKSTAVTTSLTAAGTGYYWYSSTAGGSIQ